jgi:hypothetical protein
VAGQHKLNLRHFLADWSADPLERSPEPVIKNGVAHYQLQVVEDDALK